ncbi:MAG: NFACT family protein [Lachnospiraceae bacterium]|nr:NFACT family protein [Lachnospiraceae bacterium]
MAFDGITISAIVHDLKDTCLDGRISKIAQPEKDEILLTIKTSRRENGGDFESDESVTKRAQVRVVLSANASLPLVYITDDNKVSPEVAPTFCMFLRKHIQNGRIVDIYQPDFERIIVFEIEHLDEMGDLKRKKLIVELMGKYSNIIFTDDENKVLESIKHISGLVSSVREVLPGSEYFVPKTEDKLNPLKTNEKEFIDIALCKPMETFKAIYSTYTGLSPMMANEICSQVEDAHGATDRLTDEDKHKLYEVFDSLMKKVKENDYDPVILYENGMPKDYCMLPVKSYADSDQKHMDSASKLIIAFYAEKEKITRIRQKSVDLRKIVSLHLERDVKKYDLQLKQLKDTEKMDKYKVYGELLHTYGYNIPEGSKSYEADNYYTGDKITIPLDPDLTPMENAAKYFDRYGKLKRTKEALEGLTIQVKNEIDHLESIMTSLDIAEKEEDLNDIKRELTDSGFIKKKGIAKKQRFVSKPFHYISSDGFHMYVGKNNYQNEELTFKVATGNDWWFHAKKRPGSHVIVKSENKELPDTTFEEAARLAAHYSKADGEGQIEIDYIQKKHVKKSPGQPVGFVIYHTNYSMLIDTDISNIQRIE